MNGIILTESFWAVVASLSSATVFLAGAVNGKFTIKGVWAQVVAWVVALLLTAGAWQLDLIGLAPNDWLNALAVAAAVGLSANGIYDIPVMRQFVALLFAKQKE